MIYYFFENSNMHCIFYTSWKLLIPKKSEILRVSKSYLCIVRKKRMSENVQLSI